MAFGAGAAKPSGAHPKTGAARTKTGSVSRGPRPAVLLASVGSSLCGVVLAPRDVGLKKYELVDLIGVMTRLCYS